MTEVSDIAASAVAATSDAVEAAIEEAVEKLDTAQETTEQLADALAVTHIQQQISELKTWLEAGQQTSNARLNSLELSLAKMESELSQALSMASLATATALTAEQVSIASEAATETSSIQEPLLPPAELEDPKEQTEPVNPKEKSEEESPAAQITRKRKRHFL